MRIFMAPGLYIQGPGVLGEIGMYAAPLGTKAFLVCDAFVLPLIEKTVRSSLEKAGVELEVFVFAGSVTMDALADLRARIEARGADIVIGAGGGRSLDAAKGGALETSLPMISVPTIASTDAPASRGVPVLDDDLQPLVVRQLPRNPDVVLVDTALIAQAPVRFLAAGIGDAISSQVEAKACIAGRTRNKHGTLPLLTGGIVARGCFDTVLCHGVAALEEARSGTAGPALENVVEAIVLMSCLAFENTGLALAHAIAPALVKLGDPTTLHGEHAAYGTLVQLVFEGRPEAEVSCLVDFYKQVGLPVSIGFFKGELEVGALISSISEIASRSKSVQQLFGENAAAAIATAMWEVETIAENLSDRVCPAMDATPQVADTIGRQLSEDDDER